MRTKYQGVTNIIRFNWHFFLIGGISILTLLALFYFCNLYGFLWLALLATFSMAISLITSWYIYDFAGLYNLEWLELKKSNNLNIANVNAGFDETTDLLKKLRPSAKITSFDFYNAQRHTEISIERARKKYPIKKEVKWIDSLQPKLSDRNFDTIVLFMSIHEIREEKERIHFLAELANSLKSTGEIIIVEHLRDWKNFLAYNIGFMHFHSKSVWESNFKEAGLNVFHSSSFTPFIRLFKLKKT